jgi:hypothetical protein
MIDANSTIVFKGLPEIIPEGELSHHIGMQRPKSPATIPTAWTPASVP